jgi:hypothetical protein
MDLDLIYVGTEKGEGLGLIMFDLGKGPNYYQKKKLDRWGKIQPHNIALRRDRTTPVKNPDPGPPTRPMHV